MKHQRACLFCIQNPKSFNFQKEKYRKALNSKISEPLTQKKHNFITSYTCPVFYFLILKILMKSNIHEHCLKRIYCI